MWHYQIIMNVSRETKTVILILWKNMFTIFFLKLKPPLNLLIFHVCVILLLWHHFRYFFSDFLKLICKRIRYIRMLKEPIFLTVAILKRTNLPQRLQFPSPSEPTQKQCMAVTESCVLKNIHTATFELLDLLFELSRSVLLDNRKLKMSAYTSNDVFLDTSTGRVVQRVERNIFPPSGSR